jgi:hypothetical protein
VPACFEAVQHGDDFDLPHGGQSTDFGGDEAVERFEVSARDGYQQVRQTGDGGGEGGFRLQ